MNHKVRIRKVVHNTKMKYISFNDVIRSQSSTTTTTVTTSTGYYHFIVIIINL